MRTMMTFRRMISRLARLDVFFARLFLQHGRRRSEIDGVAKAFADLGALLLLPHEDLVRHRTGIVRLSRLAIDGSRCPIRTNIVWRGEIRIRRDTRHTGRLSRKFVDRRDRIGMRRIQSEWHEVVGRWKIERRGKWVSMRGTVDIELGIVLLQAVLFQAIGLLVDVGRFQTEQWVSTKMGRFTPQLFEIRRELSCEREREGNWTGNLWMTYGAGGLGTVGLFHAMIFAIFYSNVFQVNELLHSE